MDLKSQASETSEGKMCLGIPILLEEQYSLCASTPRRPDNYGVAPLRADTIFSAAGGGRGSGGRSALSRRIFRAPGSACSGSNGRLCTRHRYRKGVTVCTLK